MKKFLVRFLLPAIAVVSFQTVDALSVAAQFPMAEGPTKERSQSDSDRDLEERIANMRYLAALAEKRGTGRKKDPKLAVEELQEDFTRIQILNRELVVNTSKTDNPDLKFVARSANEINKRAERLMSNLALPEPNDQMPAARREAISDRDQLKKSITALGWLIYRFTKNPMFKEAKVIEASAAERARRDLVEIIARSRELGKASEQLRKEGGK